MDVTARAEPALPQPVSVLITLPEPTGADAIGVVDLHLIDTSRRDPYKAAVPRELMVSIWYPATNVAGLPVRPWLSPRLAQMYADSVTPVGAPSAQRWAFGPSHGYLDAGAETSRGRRPIIVFSPGKGLPRELSTAQAEDLASHGFVVVTLSHTHETSATEFPGGRIEESLLPPATDPGEDEAQGTTALATRVADTRFVLDELADLAAGHNPDADQHALPANLAGVLDVSKVAMFGHSLGGATVAQAMHDDRRIAAGVDLDGRLWGSVVTDGLDRPFMLINREGHDRAEIPGMKQFWAAGHGLKLNFRLNGAQHHSFCDNQLIAAPLVAAGVVSSAAASQLVGTIDPRSSIDLQRSYLRGFFDMTLGRYDDLPQAPANFLHPEMVPVP
ncbi:alpha/beta hydrolase family protein [Nocardia sp. NPDC051052]|uniref:alpha/beta hydrolase family protein n=1 Tax=Nocardia sp. NPDC051052 TaxID=3364322 RepID=UPI0037BDA77B